MICPTPRPAEAVAVNCEAPETPEVGVKVTVAVAAITPVAAAVSGLLMLTVPAPIPVMRVPGWIPVPVSTWPTAKPVVEAVVIVEAAIAPPVAVKLARLRIGFSWSVVPR